MRDDSAEIFSQSFLQEALMSCFGIGRDVHSLMLFFQDFLCQLQRFSPFKVPLKDGFGEIVMMRDMRGSCIRSLGYFQTVFWCTILLTLLCSSQWGAADAEIRVPSGETSELKRSPFNAWSRSVYGHTCYAYCQGFLPCLYLPFRSIHLQFFKTSPEFSCVGFG